MRYLLVVAALGLAGCVGPFIPVTNLDQVPNEKMQQAMNIELLRITGPRKPVTALLGPVQGNSCKNKVWDPPPSETDALMRLRLAAVEKGADAVADYSCTVMGTDTYGTNCWASITCKGIAVKVN